MELKAVHSHTWLLPIVLLPQLSFLTYTPRVSAAWVSLHGSVGLSPIWKCCRPWDRPDPVRWHQVSHFALLLRWWILVLETKHFFCEEAPTGGPVYRNFISFLVPSLWILKSNLESQALQPNPFYPRSSLLLSCLLLCSGILPTVYLLLYSLHHHLLIHVSFPVLVDLSQVFTPLKGNCQCLNSWMSLICSISCWINLASCSLWVAVAPTKVRSESSTVKTWVLTTIFRQFRGWRLHKGGPYNLILLKELTG